MTKRLLFVDDEPMVLSGLRRSLRSMGDAWEMNFVESGPAALELLEGAPYEAIVTDMRMPRMDGAQLLEEVKRRHPDMVRIVLSGQSSREAIFRSITPAHQYLSKPCDPEELKLRLTQAFAMRDMLADQNLKSVVSGLKSIPSLPALYGELMAELQSEKASLGKIVEIISKDVGMTAKILQLANSAFIGLRCQVTNPTQALSLIGIETVRTLVLSVHVFSEFQEHSEIATYVPALWKHSVEVASLSQHIATLEGSAKTIKEESFTAGLLHDVGKVVLLAELPAEYCAILGREPSPHAELMVLEKERFGCTHAEVGAYLMGIWGLPFSLVRAVAHHHNPAAGMEKCFSPLAAVHGADAIAGSTDTSPINRDIHLDEAYLSKIGLHDKVAAWQEFHQKQITRNAEEGLL